MKKRLEQKLDEELQFHFDRIRKVGIYHHARKWFTIEI